MSRPRVALAVALLLGCAGPAPAQAPPPARPVRLAPAGMAGGEYMRVRLRGTLELSRVVVDGLPLAELSGLAWDDDDGVLHAVSDRGYLLRLVPVIVGGRLTSVRALRARPLRDAAGRPLRGRLADAEGLAILGGRNGRVGDATLLVSFEQQPRVVEYRPDGTPLRTLPLPPGLAAVERYASGNLALESLTVHPREGVLVAPERPLRGADPRRIPITALDGRRWRYPLSERHANSLVELEALPDGSVLALERSFSLAFGHRVTALRRIAALPEAPGSAPLAVEDLAVLDSADGWNLDNFEGLARHHGMRFFLVSDDNGLPWEKTLLVYLEILPRRAPGSR